ncbi:hypothetical protein I79_009384 [Cricetulus griseus]|uniref:Uncharacterized protein n=1 Tax=Cricetulus griseus TaxID=10029 RepID=G3HFM2_CRIGR|nr:hypothetical protein I79_009384 [Cricetulus griseus]
MHKNRPLEKKQNGTTLLDSRVAGREQSLKFKSANGTFAIPGLSMSSSDGPGDKYIVANISREAWDMTQGHLGEDRECKVEPLQGARGRRERRKG